MKLCSILYKNQECAAIYTPNGILPLSHIIRIYDLPEEWMTFQGLLPAIPRLQEWMKTHETDVSKLKLIPIGEIKFAPLFRNPGKIWGIGLNYKAHASDLDENTPDIYPGSFMKPKSTIIGYDDNINIPELSHKTTGEAELGIIIGKEAKNIDKNAWKDYVAGFTTIIDMTAEDILRKNPRYLTLCKSFDTFFSFGPVMITADEFTEEEILNLSVTTILNDQQIATNQVKNMTFTPAYLVWFHSQVMTLKPGDVISTGTPKAVTLRNGDIIQCNIDRFPSLKNPVIDTKV